MDLKEALLFLDPENDGDWTSDGLPRVDRVIELIGGTVTRQEITNAVPSLTRETAVHQPDHEDVEAERLEEPPAVIDAAYVEPEDDVVSMPAAAVYTKVELIDRALTEFGRQSAVLAQRRADVIAKIKDLGRRSEMLSKARAMLQRQTGKTADTQHSDTIRSYLDGVHGARQGRIARAQRFIEAGTNVKDVVKQLVTASPVDAAMARRKPSTSALRKEYPRAVQR